MKLSLFENAKEVLLVGEGNFSFAVTLVKHKVSVNLTATCYENDIRETGKKNIEFLEKHGIRIFLGVDATKLQKHNILSSEQFDIVIFNFPHVGGKMRIEKNRDLLKNFFISVKSLLNKDGQVFVSLCDGQGGTLADTSKRQWNDSWQVTEMAAHGNFILVAVELFDSKLFETYTVTGYRSLEKQFNTEGSLTHIFNLADKPCKSNIAPDYKVNLQHFYYKKSMNYQEMLSEIHDIAHKSQDKGNLTKYPNTYSFDITFSINQEFSVAKLYEVLYNHTGLIIHNVEFLYSYTFPDLRETNTFKITYKTRKFAVHRKLVIDLHENVIADVIEKVLNVTVSR